jgi:hypothetical protein
VCECRLNRHRSKHATGTCRVRSNVPGNKNDASTRVIGTCARHYRFYPESKSVVRHAPFLLRSTGPAAR